MMRSEAVQIIKRGLGFRQTQDAAIVAALQEAQRDLELGQTLPNWLLAFDQPISVVAGTATIAPPDGFLRLHEDYPMYYVNSEGARVFVPRKGNVEAREAYGVGGVVTPSPTPLFQPNIFQPNVFQTVTQPVTVPGSYPQVFVQDTKRRFTLIPTPQLALTLYLTAYKAADVLDSEIENAWLLNAPNYLIGMAGVRVAGDVRDKGAMDKFSMMAKMGARSMLSDVVEDELAGRPIIMGRDH